MSTAIVPSSLVRLHVAARHCSVSTSTVRRLCNSGLVTCHRTPVGGHRTVSLSEVCEVIGVAPPEEGQTEKSESEGGRCVVAYARVSTNKQKQEGNLARQIDRLKAYCAEHFPGQTVKIISEVGSGLSDTRPGFLRLVELLAAGKVAALVCEYRDRIARFGVGVVQKLCEAKGATLIETRTGTEQEQELTAEQEMSRDILSIVTVFANKASGKKGGMAVKIVPPAGFKERVCQLAGSGLSRRDILKVIERENWTCQNTGKKLGERAIRNIVDSLPAEKVVPASVKTFIKKRCTVGASKREATANLYTAYVVHCGTLKTRPLGRDKMTDYLKQAVKGLRLENGAVTIAYGVCLKGGRPA